LTSLIYTELLLFVIVGSGSGCGKLLVFFVDVECTPCVLPFILLNLCTNVFNWHFFKQNVTKYFGLLIFRGITVMQ